MRHFYVNGYSFIINSEEFGTYSYQCTKIITECSIQMRRSLSAYDCYLHSRMFYRSPGYVELFCKFYLRYRLKCNSTRYSLVEKLNICTV